MANMKCVLTNNHYILCYGGMNVNGQIINKLYSYDYLENIW